MILQLGKHTVEYIEGLSSITDRYDCFLVDIWGVLHDAAKPYPGVIDCLKQLKKHGKRVVLISNAARRSSVLAKELIQFGIVPELYESVVTSGEVVWNAFNSNRNEELLQLGRNYYLFGSEKYLLTEGLSLKRTEKFDTADFVFAIGVTGNPSSTADHEIELRDAADRGLPMVCANPDQLVVRNGIMGIAPGALAARYHEIGGRVIYFGKPYQDIYRRCLKLLEGVPKTRIVAIGDALTTDIKGANNNNLDSILVASGIHAEQLQNIPGDDNELQAICHQENQYPSMITKGFIWQNSTPPKS